MNKLLSIIILVLFSHSLFAGGLVTNTNQSASWVRMPSQNASTSISAVYFNPAGVMKLDNGFHISLSNQFISQNRKVENFYSGPDSLSGLNNSMFEGSVFAPLFPSVYAVYKRDKFAVSFGINPVGGGGSAKYAKGLPSIEMKPSDLVYSLNPLGAATGVTDYRLNSSFEGSSVFMGYQGGISFDVSDNVSLYAGVRYITAKNTYNGYLKDIELYNFGNSGAWTRADAIMTGIAANATTGATNLQAAINGGLLVGTDPLTDPTAIAGLQQLGINPTGYTNNNAVAAYTAAAKKFNNNAVLLADQEADVEETGNGITPVFGINIAASDKLNIAFKLEGQTFIELTRNTTKDVQTGFLSPGDTIPDTMFPNGRKYNSDMPAMLTMGIDYQALSKLKLSVSGNLYFDTTEKLSYGKKVRGEYVRNYTVIDENSWEVAGGLEFDVTEKLLVSGGLLISNNSVNSLYQSDMAYSLDSKTICLGAAFNVSEKMQVNLGAGYTIYDEGFKYIRYEFSPTKVLYPKETYYKDNLFVGIGIDISL
jgi:long-subunit fatty acid transport protein